MQNRAANPAAPAPTLNIESSKPDNPTGIDSRHTILVLPSQPVCRDVLERQRWLGRGIWSGQDRGIEALDVVLSELQVPRTSSGLAALRLWGQTGTRPGNWLAAADPVYLEAMLDHVRLHAFRPEELSGDDVQELVALINEELPGADRDYRQYDGKTYLQGGQPFDTAASSAMCIDGEEPDAFLPRGPGAREHDRLLGELQLLLHAARLNQSRDERGQPPVNSLWFWGGGSAPEIRPRALPTLHANDPLFRGYWLSCDAPVRDWTATMPWQDSPSEAFVAVVPPDCDDSGAIAGLLGCVRAQLLRGRIRRLSILYGNRFVLRLRRRELFAFWRTFATPFSEEHPR